MPVTWHCPRLYQLCQHVTHGCISVIVVAKLSKKGVVILITEEIVADFIIDARAEIKGTILYRKPPDKVAVGS